MLFLIFLGKIIILVANIRYYSDKRQIKSKIFLNIYGEILVFNKREEENLNFGVKAFPLIAKNR